MDSSPLFLRKIRVLILAFAILEQKKRKNSHFLRKILKTSKFS